MAVTGSDVMVEKSYGVAWERIFVDDHCVSFKEPVSLVARQEKLEKKNRVNLYCIAFCHLIRLSGKVNSPNCINVKKPTQS